MRRFWKLLFVFFVACTLSSFMAWSVVLTRACANPRKPLPETQQVIPYNCHGMTVFLSPLEDALRHWLLPVGAVFLFLSLAAAAMALLSIARVRVEVRIRRE